MTDREALLRAIIENPGDDAPRLVYADWLDEHGDPDRAELIRVQCSLESGLSGAEQYLRLRELSDRLVEAHRPRWMAELPRPRAIVWSKEFRRGFVEEARSWNWEPIGKFWSRIFAATPLIDLNVANVSVRSIRDLLGREETRFLRNLWLGVTDVDRAARLIAEHPSTGSWQLLHLWPIARRPLSDDGAAALLNSTFLTRLRYFSTAAGRLSAQTQQALQDRFGTRFTYLHPSEGRR